MLCEKCNTEFEPKTHNQRFCKRRCQRYLIEKNSRRKRGRPYRNLICEICSIQFDAWNKEQKYCGNKCASQARKKYLSIPECLDCADRKIDKNIGYVRVYVGKDYPGANNRGYAYEHRVVMELHLGRYLTKDEHVHHINHCRWDNRLSNLKVLSKEEHAKLTQQELKEGYEITIPEGLPPIDEALKIFLGNRKRKKKEPKIKKQTIPYISKCPSKEILVELIWQLPSTKIAEIYGVSDKAVQKWCKKYDLSKPPKGYWTKFNDTCINNLVNVNHKTGNIAEV